VKFSVLEWVMRERFYYVYILTNKDHNVLYIGVTNDIARRVWEHKDKQAESFTKRYNVNKLVYYELHHTIDTAITREKQLKAWNRAWKDDLVSTHNPKWDDLYNSLI
jgi:putative endonuclease